MKKLYNAMLVLSVPALFLFLTSEVMYPTGSPGGRTGSPGDNGANCTGCHSGTPTTVDLWIYSPELLVSGYYPDQEYNVLVYGLDENANKFGFEATVEDLSGNKIGTITPDAFGWTQLANNNKSITHTALGTTPVLDTGTYWIFTWLSPPESVGTIKFYAAVNAANGDNTNSGDHIYLSSFAATPATGISGQGVEAAPAIYPNPSTGIINIHAAKTENDNLEIFNRNGQLVYSKNMEQGDHRIDLSHLKKGIYIARVGSSSQRILLR